MSFTYYTNQNNNDYYFYGDLPSKDGSILDVNTPVNVTFYRRESDSKYNYNTTSVSIGLRNSSGAIISYYNLNRNSSGHNYTPFPVTFDLKGIGGLNNGDVLTIVARYSFGSSKSTPYTEGFNEECDLVTGSRVTHEVGYFAVTGMGKNVFFNLDGVAKKYNNGWVNIDGGLRHIEGLWVNVDGILHKA